MIDKTGMKDTSPPVMLPQTTTRQPQQRAPSKPSPTTMTASRRPFSQSIPLPASHIRHTPSELQLRKDNHDAMVRDLNMVDRMQHRSLQAALLASAFPAAAAVEEWSIEGFDDDDDEVVVKDVDESDHVIEEIFEMDL